MDKEQQLAALDERREYCTELLAFNGDYLGKKISEELNTLANEILAKLDAFNAKPWLDDSQQKERAILVAKLEQTMGIRDVFFNEESIKEELKLIDSDKKDVQAMRDIDLKTLEDVDELVY